MNLLEDFIKGTCEDMCPKREREMREREGLLHILEIKSGTENMKRPRADLKKIVKEYCRSAAGQRMPKSPDLRSLATLRRTVRYLLRLAYHPPAETDWSLVYDFVSDRLRAVRQDLVMQGLSGEESLSLMESMVLFHVYAGYMLCEQSLSVFDPKLNTDLLLDCLKRSLVIYDYGATSKHRSSIETLYGIVGLGNNEALTRLASLPHELRTSDWKLVCEMVLALDMGNFVRGFRLLAKLPPPLACAVAPHMPALRKCALQVLSVGYSSKLLRVSGESVARWLVLPSVDCALKECAHYGLQCDETSVSFQRTTFKDATRPMQASRMTFVDEKLDECSDLLNLFSTV